MHDPELERVYERILAKAQARPKAPTPEETAAVRKKQRRLEKNRKARERRAAMVCEHGLVLWDKAGGCRPCRKKYDRNRYERRKAK